MGDFPMNFIATYIQNGKPQNFPYEGSEEKVIKTFERHMEKLNPPWANLICVETGEQISRYEQRDIVGVFEGKATTIKEPDGNYIGLWTDGVSLLQKGKKAKLLADNEMLSAFRLKKGIRYRVTVMEINEDENEL